MRTTIDAHDRAAILDALETADASRSICQLEREHVANLLRNDA
jgi:hypothetical protein